MPNEMLIAIAVGFIAQMVDGALGMAYGLTVSSILLSTGVPPVVSSAAVHVAETFTTAASGFSHWRAGNVDRQLFWRLVIPGVISAFIGAYVLSSVSGEAIMPWVSAYLLLAGLVVLYKAIRGQKDYAETRKILLAPLGLIGGFLDAVGGGGWGPVVTSTLLGRGAAPRTVIGSVNLCEFFVTLTVAGTLVTMIGTLLWPIIVGLIIGGVLAAPFAALVVRHVPGRVLMFVVGTVVVFLAAWRIYGSLTN